jgi:hypothetical protein
VAHEDEPTQGKHRAPKALATSPSGETGGSTNSAQAKPGKTPPTPEISDKEIWNTLVGRGVSRDTFIDGQIRERELRNQSDAIVERMERCGLQGRSARGGVSIIGLVSGQVEKATDYRNCNLIPAQQSRNVHDMLKHVRYLVDTSPRKSQFRMLVVSGGWCRFDKYRKHHKLHTRRMSKFAAHRLLKEFGIEVLFYNVENTIHRSENTAMLNMHSHALFRSRRFLGKKKWIKFIQFARDFFPKGFVHDSKIENPKEVVKYVFKPSEFDLLTDDEFKEFAQQVIGGRCQVDPETGEILTREGPGGELIEVLEGPLKFFHPLGSMRAFRAELRKDRQKLIMVPTADDQWVWRKTEKKKPRQIPEAQDCPRDNILLAITRPMPKFTPRMEPCLIVQDYTGDFDKLVRANGLTRAVSDARNLFADRARKEEAALRRAENASGSEATSMKHTTTTTVPEWDWEGGVKHHSPPPDPAPPPHRGRLH